MTPDQLQAIAIMTTVAALVLAFSIAGHRLAARMDRNDR